MIVRDNSPTSSLKETYLELRQGTTSHLAAALNESSRILGSLPELSVVSRDESLQGAVYDTSGFVDTPAVSQLPFCDLLDQLAQPQIPAPPRSPVSARSLAQITTKKQLKPPSHFYRQFRDTRKPAVEFDFRNL